MYIGEGGTLCTRGGRGYPMYIGDGGYPMYTFGQKSGTEPEYPPLRGPSSSYTHLGVLGGPSPVRTLAKLARKRPFWGI